MGTRAVAHCGGDSWVATHWDGYPDKHGLGQDIIKELRKKFTVAPEDAQYRKGQQHSLARAACWRAAADHSIDDATNQGEESFNRMYGDFAEYEYKIVHDTETTCSTVMYKGRGIKEWKGSTGNGWKSLGTVCMKTRKKRAPRRKKPGC